MNRPLRGSGRGLLLRASSAALSRVVIILVVRLHSYTRRDKFVYRYSAPARSL